jgi:hypothetical protein
MDDLSDEEAELEDTVRQHRFAECSLLTEM